VSEDRIDDETNALRTAPEVRGGSAGFLVLPLLAMLMIFSGLILQWGLGPIVAVGMAVTLAAAAERLSQRGRPRTGDAGQGWIRSVLRIATDLAARAEREPNR
jgi:hypothetical protein